ncbi:unnamed protein product, partial [Polarella glacialis]
VQFSNEIWPSLRFLKTQDGIRVARVRATPAPLSADPRILELCVADPSVEAAGSRLPRAPALFLGLGQEPLRLSGLKEALRTSEWSRDDTEVEFQGPAMQTGRPWSARVLTAGSGTAAVGWAGSGRREGGGGSDTGAGPVLRLEGVPSEEFFMARAALYKRCAII